MSKPLAVIIEDEVDLSEIYSMALRGGGFETEVIRDGQAAVDRLAGPAPDIIVLDLHLPHIEGNKIYQQIRANERYSKTVIMVTTADAQMADRMRGKADLVLVKPVSVDQLRELAKRMLQRWHGEDDSAK